MNMRKYLRIIGSSIISTTKRTGGKIPEMIPTISFGSLHIQCSHLYCWQRE